MKVKELIEELQKCSPDAIVGWMPIHHIEEIEPIWFPEELEPYWDGYVAEVDAKNRKWIYNINKNKVVLHTWDENEFVSLFFYDKWIIPSFENIKKNIINLPKERYLKRFKESYDSWYSIYVEMRNKKIEINTKEWLYQRKKYFGG